MSASIPATILLAVLAAGPNVDEKALKPDDLIFSQRGNVPILITAPHGGWVEIPGVPERQWRRDDRINTRPDEQTAQLAQLLNEGLQKSLGKKPFVVIARFHRRSLDANRPAELAYQSPAAKPYYDAYHRKVREYVEEIKEKWGGGLLIDVHGQNLMPRTVMRGTRDGRTTANLIRRHGWPALLGPDSIFGRLQKAGYDVFPSKEGVSEGDWTHVGSYTAATYGGPEGIDAIQLEIGFELRRTKEVYTRFATDLARAIAGFYRTYMKRDRPAKPTGQSHQIRPRATIGSCGRRERLPKRVGQLARRRISSVGVDG